MDGPNPIPEAISHRQLTALLQSAVPEQAAPKVDADGDQKRELDALLHRYGSISQRLLQALQQGDSTMALGRSPRQLMVIGALQVHVQMALQALAASQG